MTFYFVLVIIITATVVVQYKGKIQPQQQLPTIFVVCEFRTMKELIKFLNNISLRNYRWNL